MRTFYSLARTIYSFHIWNKETKWESENEIRIGYRAFWPVFFFHLSLMFSLLTLRIEIEIYLFASLCHCRFVRITNELNVLYKLFHAHRNMTTRLFVLPLLPSLGVYLSLVVYILWLIHITYLFVAFIFPRSHSHTSYFPSLFTSLSGSWHGWDTLVCCININYREQSVLMLQLISSMNITSISLVFLCVYWVYVYTIIHIFSSSKSLLRLAFSFVYCMNFPLLGYMHILIRIAFDHTEKE